ncbi:hypothetical protein LTR85_007248 [Meristemomyces frigidus]|nr:hypothetical protein LTR85_007248 [Meristemomyces frigidus]
MEVFKISLSRTTVCLILSALALAGFAILLSPRKDPQEPPFLPSSLPLVGHLIHMFGQGAGYYTDLYQQYHQGIYTLPIFRFRMYIISSPDWVSVIYKSPQKISFNALVVPMVQKVFCMDQRTMEIMRENMNDEKGDHSGVLHRTHDMILQTMKPGPHLDELNRNFLEQLTPHVNGLAKEGGTEKIKLWYWLRHHFSLASAAAIYGPENPFALNPALEQDFWDLEASIAKLAMLPYPSVFARKAEAGRRRMCGAMIEYAEKERWKQASQLAKNRAEVNLGHGLSTRMYGTGEVSMLFAVLANTVPSTFWLLSNIFADPQLLADVRAEVGQCLRQGEDNKRIINATKVKAECPLFFSTMKETLRMIAAMNTIRWVLEDTQVTNHNTDKTYLLKKGSMVQIAANVIHFKSEIYGEDAATFNPRRFLPKDGKTVGDPAANFRDEKGKIHAGSFRTFGGGNNICPGRHFAQTEMQAFVSVFVAGFEIESADGGQYVPPPIEGKKMPVAQGLIQPGRDVEVNVRRRRGYEEIEWDFEM